MLRAARAHQGLGDGGQNIDVPGAVHEVVERMGLGETIHSLTTTEEGTRFVDAILRRIFADAGWQAERVLDGFERSAAAAGVRALIRPDPPAPCGRWGRPRCPVRA